MNGVNAVIVLSLSFYSYINVLGVIDYDLNRKTDLFAIHSFFKTLHLVRSEYYYRLNQYFIDKFYINKEFAFKFDNKFFKRNFTKVF